VGIKPDLASRELIQNGPPDFQGLCFLVRLHARVSGLEEFLGLAIISNGTSQGALSLEGYSEYARYQNKKTEEFFFWRNSSFHVWFS
jgi:hypothetical protein